MIEEHLSVHDRLKRLERAVQLQEERESANLRRIEQLASRVRELEQARGELEVMHEDPAVITAEAMRQALHARNL